MIKTPPRSPVKSPRILPIAFLVDMSRPYANQKYTRPYHHMEETLQDYMYYLYNGRRYEIRNKTATPGQNASIVKIWEAIQHIHIQDSN